MQTTVFLSGLSRKKNKRACCENIEAIDDVLENFFSTSSLGPRSLSPHLQNVCPGVASL